MTNKVLDLSAEMITERMMSIGLTAHDKELLLAAWPFVAPHSRAFVTALYRRFAASPELAHLIAHESRVERLMSLQQSYLEEIFCRPVDEEYVRGRLRIGSVHHRIRVTPQWYLATCAHFLCDHVDVLLESASSAAAGFQTMLAFMKSMLFDAGIVLDAYGRCEDLSFHTRSSSNADSPSSPPRPETPAVRPPGHRDRSMSRIQLTVQETNLRAGFVGLTGDDLERLRSLSPVFTSALPEVLDDFYTFFSTSPAVSDLVPDELVDRLKLQVAAYWHEFAQGQFDRPYAASRMRIGVIHEQIGLGPRWYITGLSRQVSGLLNHLPLETPQLAEVVKSFFRGLFFDMTFVVDAYMEARAETLIHAEGVANRLLSGLSSAVAVLNENMQIRFANEKLIALTGIDPGMLYLMSITDAIPIPEIQLQLTRMQAETKPKSSGLAFWGPTEFHITLMEMEKSTASSSREFAIILDDISDLLKLTTRMEDDGRQYLKLVDTVSAVLWQMDLATQTITTISRPAIELTGYRDMNFLARPNAWLNVIHPLDRDRFSACCSNLPDQGDVTCEYRMIRGDGREIWVSSQLACVSRTGEPVIIAAVTTDITKHRMADQLRLAAVGQVASSIAHLLNNSLTAMVCNMELQAAELGSPQNSPFLQNALDASRRAARVVAQLQAFAGGQILQPVVQSLNRFVQEGLSGWQELAGRMVSFRTSLQANLWNCRVDQLRLHDVIASLCANARDAMPGGGQITLETRNLEISQTDFDDPGFNRKWIEISVSDNGHGMTPDVKKRAVDPFFSTQPLAEKNGLGLSMAYGFMAQSGGHMLLQSEPGIGTRVALRFPRLQSELTTAEPVAAYEGGPLVLIVDDDPLVLRATSMLVTRSGFRVITAENGEDALKLAQDQSVDILLTDICLGQGMDGVEVAQLVSRQFSRAGIILMSGYTGASSTEHPLPAGWGQLSKPFSREQLVSALQAAVPRLH